MNSYDPIFIAPPLTEVPDYVWLPRYGRSSWLPGRPSKQPKDTAHWISHLDAESALQAAKQSCRMHPGRWFGQSSEGPGPTIFCVYEEGKVVEHHVPK